MQAKIPFYFYKNVHSVRGVKSGVFEYLQQGDPYSAVM